MDIEFPSESFIEDYIYSYLIENEYCPFTGKRIEFCWRQPELGPYGRADIIYLKEEIDGFSGGIFLDVRVVELKKGPLKASDISQLCRYIDGVERALDSYCSKLDMSFKVSGILAGTESKEDDFVFLSKALTSIDVYFMKLTMGDGFCSEKVTDGWQRLGRSFKDIRPMAREFFEWRSEEI